ncbi:hypothetical protein IE81DRAFT_346621 [Ceraceosorus guamensis]|uniref:Uncharacterized protein n=1 Tax=Ceraceosorus guamensis TaxID=1522189 RepID=A0A316W155_9BASI|nr:hypothetical protein IE81DRAFT_346621 [Ceraceosorus guamensis]PWN43419.1 hypothetical protein IE81DRAFT_346621 [Ceraceosorus guamensis]
MSLSRLAEGPTWPKVSQDSASHKGAGMAAASSSSPGSIRSTFPPSLEAWSATARQVILHHGQGKEELCSLELPSYAHDLYARLSLLSLLDGLTDRLHNDTTRAGDAHLPAALMVTIAWLLHRPYSAAPTQLHPFATLLAARARSVSGRHPSVSVVIDGILGADAATLSRLGQSSALTLIEKAERRSSQRQDASGKQEEAIALISAARTRALNLGETRSLTLMITALRDMSDLIQPAEMCSIASHNQPSLVVRLITSLQSAAKAIPHLIGLAKLEPSLRSLDLFMRLLTSEVKMSISQNEQKVTMTLKRLSKTIALGGWLASVIAHVEQAEEKREMDQERVGEVVSRLCRFIRALMSHDILPNGDGAYGQNTDEDSEVDLACIVECRHFALRYGRFRDAGELYASLLRVEL